MDLDGEVPELRALATYFAERDGALWVAEAGGAVVGMVGTHPLGEGAWEICKLYVARPQRGRGVAQALITTAEAHARAHGATAMKLWSDTRFERAHRFYEKHAYVRQGPIRVLDDLSHSLEFAYAKPLTGVVVRELDAVGVASAAARLAEVMKDCVDSGDARAVWRQAATEVATGRRCVLAAWAEGELVGTVQLDLGLPPDQSHRANLQKLLVQAGARRRGIGRLLMQQAEAAARQAGRSLLVLDTRAGDAAEHLVRGLGWTEAGCIPGDTRDADGTLRDTLIFYRAVQPA
ncbi:GNAT family N-acetyltransferase [Rhodovastum atsumiense]|uniref:GNAT family N-acetyltransferase n=2 Tax=Rhodovastum atsumiense TaxID=504468 RepID=A0A5M6IPC4_9PROT|nr:GNAT family N-acetyltransferase [Rhodovastum atsumiense]